MPAPALCRYCGGVHDASACWLGLSHESRRLAGAPSREIDSYHAAYLALGSGYTVLRRWKIHRGWALNRRILKLSTEVRHRLQNLDLTCIVPIPQNTLRAWRMGGSPAQLVADWLSKEIAVPVLPLLATGKSGGNPLRQGELKRSARLENRLSFELASEYAASLAKSPQILLVDDFMTTGHTLGMAAQKLKCLRNSSVHVFCLAVRPRLSRASGQHDRAHLEPVNSTQTRA